MFYAIKYNPLPNCLARTSYFTNRKEVWNVKVQKVNFIHGAILKDSLEIKIPPCYKLNNKSIILSVNKWNLSHPIIGQILTIPTYLAELERKWTFPHFLFFHFILKIATPGYWVQYVHPHTDLNITGRWLRATRQGKIHDFKKIDVWWNGAAVVDKTPCGFRCILTLIVMSERLFQSEKQEWFKLWSLFYSVTVLDFWDLKLDWDC